MVFYQAVTILFLAILPLFPLQGDIKVIYGIILLALLLLPVFVKNVGTDIKEKKVTTIFFLLFLLAGAISTIFSIDQKQSFLQLLLYLSYFVIFTTIPSIFPTFKSKKLLVTCYLLLVTVLSLISLYHILVLHYVNKTPEGVSFMWIYYGHNHLSALLIFAIPINLFFLKTYWNKKGINILLLVTCYLLLVTLFLTFGIGSIISLSLSAFIITLFLFKPAGGLRKIISATLIISICVLFLFGIRYFSQAPPFKKNSISSFKSRQAYWQQAFNNFQKYPLTGSGLYTFRTAYTMTNNQFRLKGDFTISFFMQILSDAGIFGLLTSIGLIGSVLWQARKKLKVKSAKFKVRERSLALAFWAALLASTINSFADFDWQLPVVFLIFWLMAGLAKNDNLGKDAG